MEETLIRLAAGWYSEDIPLFRAIMTNWAGVIRYLVVDQKNDFRQTLLVTMLGDTLDFQDLLSDLMYVFCYFMVYCFF